MSPSLTTRTPARARPDDRAADLAEIARRERIDRRTRAGFAVGFFLLGAALAWPALVAVPYRVLAAAALVALAAVGAHAILTTAAGWVEGRYEVLWSHSWRVWRWRIVRRWYAPGSTVWRTAPGWGAGPLVVLGWHADAACRQVWALVYDGAPLMSGGDGAVWLPLTDLRPTPPPSPAALARHPITGAR
ncbi:hypothetical protein ACQP1W_36895 [Spirillospora sp. CA-255316]